MRACALVLPLLVAFGLDATSPLKPEGPLLTHASAIYRAPALVLPATPEDVLTLHQAGDVSLAFGALTGRWIADRLAEGKIPDGFLFQRMLQGFAWNEAGVLQLQAAGVDKGVLRALATAKPLGLSSEAQGHLVTAGLDPQIAAMLGASPMAALPPLKSMADQAMGSMLAGHPMAQNPAFKSQLDAYLKKIETEMGSRFRSESFRKELWERVIENWRERVQVGNDPGAVLAPVATEILDAPPESPERAAAGMAGVARAGNDLFLKSTPLGVALGAADVLAVLNAKTAVRIRATNPKEIESFRFEETTRFLLRRNPSDLVLMRLQDEDGTPTARLTKGVFRGRDFRPADEPVPVEVAQEGEVWTVKPTSRLAPGSYAFLMGGKSIVFVPFVVK